MSEKCVCSCGKTKPKLIFSCSGAADTGEITDLTARIIDSEKKAKMFCLAGIGGKVEPIIQQTKAADKIIVLDGCSLDCAKKTLENGGFNDFIHVRLTDLGFIKGKSPVTDERINKVVEKVSERI